MYRRASVAGTSSGQLCRNAVAPELVGLFAPDDERVPSQAATREILVEDPQQFGDMLVVNHEAQLSDQNLPTPASQR